MKIKPTSFWEFVINHPSHRFYIALLHVICGLFFFSFNLDGGPETWVPIFVQIFPLINWYRVYLIYKRIQ